MICSRSSAVNSGLELSSSWLQRQCVVFHLPKCSPSLALPLLGIPESPEKAALAVSSDALGPARAGIASLDGGSKELMQLPGVSVHCGHKQMAMRMCVWMGRAGQACTGHPGELSRSLDGETCS